MKTEITRELVEALARELGLKVVSDKQPKMVTPASTTVSRAYPADVANRWSKVRLECKICGLTKPVLSLSVPRVDDFGLRERQPGSGHFLPQARCRKCRSSSSRSYYLAKHKYRTKNNP